MYTAYNQLYWVNGHKNNKFSLNFVQGTEGMLNDGDFLSFSFELLTECLVFGRRLLLDTSAKRNSRIGHWNEKLFDPADNNHSGKKSRHKQITIIIKAMTHTAALAIMDGPPFPTNNDCRNSPSPACLGKRT